jgi:hypothetical protein
MPIQRPHYELDDEYRQLALNIDVETLALDDKSVSPEEARLRSETARGTLLALKATNEQPAWFARFELLMDGGWPWRQATYIAWASMPKENRKPETQDSLAKEFLNLTSDRAISTWRKRNPAIDTTIAIMQSMELWEHRADSFKNLIEGMKKAGMDYKFFNHLKLFLEMTGDYVPLTQLAAVLKRKADGEPSDLSEEDIVAMGRAAKELNDDATHSTKGGEE